MRIFPNREARLRLVTALWVEQSEDRLSGKPYLVMSHIEPEEDTGFGTVGTTKPEQDDMAS